ncbi:MAG TPA: DUF5110 domain-containing protein [Caldilineae bacterium]|nr:DUF5110 domain-containing protein [Caldilineae bacterium]
MSLFDRLRFASQLLAEVARGARLVGMRNVVRTALYRPRLTRMNRRFGGPWGPGFQAPAGNVVGMEAMEDGLMLRLEQGVCSVQVISPHMLRVRIAAGDVMPPYASYATLPEAKRPTPFSWREEGESIRFAVDDRALILRKTPFGLAWEDEMGQGSLGTETLTWEEEGGRLHLRFPETIWWYGLGERACHLALERRTYALTTRDPEGYGPGDDPLYVNIPFLLGVHEGRAFGLLLDRMSDGEITLRRDGGIEYRILGDEIRLDIIFGPEPAQVLARYADLTGRAPLPPLWTLGYHQSRWSYETEAVVRAIAREFRQRRIPCDAIHFDIDYMDGFRCFTWDRQAFPDLPGLLADLHASGFKAVGMIDPGIKVDEHYDVCADGVAQDVFCRLPDGSLFHGPVWPGECYFPDFTSERVRTWWGQWYKRLVDAGFDGFWNDMNEPTIFGGQTFPPRVRHAFEGLGAAHWQVHSAYGMQMARATLAGLERWRPHRRNWVFTRSAYAGTQRYASSWTGDNRSAWEDLRITPAMLMNLGLSGLSFTGSDIGGFEGSPTPELYARWLTSAAFHPFFRTHTAKGAAWQEPWRYGEEVEAICRTYIELRYRLLPAIYTLFWQYATWGMPMMRPMFFEDPADEVLLALDDQWLFGDHLLVAPALEEGMVARDVLLPAGDWYDFWSDERLAGPAVISSPTPLDRVPLFVRAGAALPMGPVRQFVEDKPDAPLELHIYPGSGVSWLYEDDGETLRYREGDYRLTRFKMDFDGHRLRIQRQMAGDWQPPARALTVVFHGVLIERAFLDVTPHSVINNQMQIEDDSWQILEAMIV